MWNTLEIAKLIATLSTPILIAYLAYLYNRKLKRLEGKQWTNQKVIEKRLQVYDELMPVLNDLFCFYCFIGNWKEITPIEIIKHKRFLDKKIHIYAPLFSSKLNDKYNLFISECFKTFTGWGNDATINSLYEKRKTYSKIWKKEWESLFSNEFINEINNNDDIAEAKINRIKVMYLNLVNEFKDNMEIYKHGFDKNIDIPNVHFFNL